MAEELKISPEENSAAAPATEKAIVEKDGKEFTFRRYAWRQFKKNKPAYISLYILGFLVIMAVLAPVLANERPLYMKYKGASFYPAFTFKTNYHIIDPKTGKDENLQLDIADWKRMDYESVVWAPVVWSPGKADENNRNYVGPSDPQKFVNSKNDTLYMPTRFKHFLGTNEAGEDLLAGLIHG
jgi:ABC-type microcin C transport system permease subunit YejE